MWQAATCWDDRALKGEASRQLTISWRTSLGKTFGIVWVA
jgi:hypothetical protein